MLAQQQNPTLTLTPTPTPTPTASRALHAVRDQTQPQPVITPASCPQELERLKELRTVAVLSEN